MAEVSSQDLHPSAGARFVFEREGEALRYRFIVYLPGTAQHTGTLDWDGEGKANIEIEPAPAGEVAWIVEGAAKLARVLKRDPKAKLIRWRDR